MTLFTKSARWAAVMACTATIGLSTIAGCQKKMPTDQEKQEAMAAAPGDIIDTATGPNMEKVTTLVAAVKAAGLVDTLKGPGPFTVFAPTNDAFAALPAGTVETLLKPENKEKLKDILLYHVHSGGVMAAEAHPMALTTVEGKSIAVTTDGDTVILNGKSKVIKADIVCKNGVIHWVDNVLMPTDAMPMPGM